MASQSTDERALTLLGQGIEPSVVASAIGVSPSYISQLLSDKVFAAQVTEQKVAALVKHTARDNAYDEMEDLLQKKFKTSISMMFKPMEVLKAMQVINSLKRRGPGSADGVTQTAEVINLILPTTIVNNYSIAPQLEKNVNNQVVRIGEQDIITVQSNRMEELLDSRKSAQPIMDANYVLPKPIPTESSPTDRTSGTES